MKTIENAKSNEKVQEKKVSKTWEAAVKYQGSGWFTYPKFVRLTEECKKR